MPNLLKPLTLEEKKFLLAVERGDMGNVRRMLQKAQKNKKVDVNCMDSLGRGALTIAIDQENLEMVELLVVMGVETRDALLHAISVEFVEAVELLLEHEELIHKEGEPYSWQKVDINTAMFTPDITPLILAAHRNNYEILKILLDRGATVPMPHDIKCGCEECIKQSEQDSLRHSLSRLNEYRALASPSLIALSSSDPILTAFQLSWDLRNLAFAEPECKSEYMDLRKQCQQFAVDLLHQSRSSQELAFILNHDPQSPPYEEGEHMKLARLELAIIYKQKKFVAHPNIQQLLAAIWYEGVPGFRRKTAIRKCMIICKVAVLFPFYCLLFMIAPDTKSGKLMRKPFMKFLIHASSYLFFLLLLILVSQRVEDQVMEMFGTESMKQMVLEKSEKQRGNPPAILEYVVLIYVIGFIYEETHEIYVEGMKSYLRNLWNFIDFTRNFLYTLVFLLRVVAYIQQTSEIDKDPSTAYIRREEWKAFDPQLIAEGLFAGANIFSALKLVHMFSINPHLGPLQISLGRMVIDIVKFFFIYSLVLFAFACGLNQLLWYFSDLEKKKCYHSPTGEADFDNAGDSCMKWRRFANVFESSQSLFWASFGMVDLDSFELTGIKTYTRFWGLLMFGSYSVINVIVLLNLLIAMMSNSYAMIDEHSDTEWKFARTKLWMSYFEEGATLPSPFNVFPRPKIFLRLFGVNSKDKLNRMSTKKRNMQEKERDYRYTAIMRALVWRYVTAMHRKTEESPVTEDDVNELKGDISSFRYEMLEVLQKNGMDISSAEKKEKAVLGKKMKVWERRLMKDFKVAPVTTDDDDMIYEPPREGEMPLAKFRRVAKMAMKNSNLNKWRQVVKGACIASQIGHCHDRDSYTKQQNLQKAIAAAEKLKTKSPDTSRAPTPIQLPDMTGQHIMKIIPSYTPVGSVKNFDQLGTTASGKTSVNLSPHLLTKGPTISICPPEGSPSPTPSYNWPSRPEVPDLINLESVKNSPILSKSPEAPESPPREEHNNFAMPRSHSPSGDNFFSEEKLLENPPSPVTSPTSSDKSLDSLDRKVLSDSKSFEGHEEETHPKSRSPSPEISVKKLVEAKNVTFSFDIRDTDRLVNGSDIETRILKTPEERSVLKESRMQTQKEQEKQIKVSVSPFLQDQEAFASTSKVGKKVAQFEERMREKSQSPTPTSSRSLSDIHVSTSTPVSPESYTPASVETRSASRTSSPVSSKIPSPKPPSSLPPSSPKPHIPMPQRSPSLSPEPFASTYPSSSSKSPVPIPPRSSSPKSPASMHSSPPQSFRSSSPKSSDFVRSSPSQSPVPKSSRPPSPKPPAPMPPSPSTSRIPSPVPTTTLDKPSENISTEKSPMASRNIQRIGDRGRRQPRTGWL